MLHQNEHWIFYAERGAGEVAEKWGKGPCALDVR